MPKGIYSRKPIEQRFAENFLMPNGPLGCWIWTGAKNNYGYGKLFYNKQYYAAHRLAYRLTHGPLKPQDEIRHTCKNRACVNPYHLSKLTSKDQEKVLSC